MLGPSVSLLNCRDSRCSSSVIVCFNASTVSDVFCSATSASAAFASDSAAFPSDSAAFASASAAFPSASAAFARDTDSWLLRFSASDSILQCTVPSVHGPTHIMSAKGSALFQFWTKIQRIQTNNTVVDGICTTARHRCIQVDCVIGWLE